MRILIAIIAIIAPLQAQILAPIMTASNPGGSPTFTVIQSVGARADGMGAMTCVGSPSVCTLTVASTGSSHVLAMLASDDAAASTFIASVTGGGTWVVPAAAELNNGCCAAASGAYVLSSSSGTTSIVITMTAALNNLSEFVFYEISGPTALDTGATPLNAVHNAGSSTIQTGAPLTVSGSPLAVIQMCGVDSGVISAAASPYNTHFINTDTASMAAFNNAAGSLAVNITSGAGAAFTSASSAVSVCNSMAFK